MNKLTILLLVSAITGAEYQAALKKADLDIETDPALLA